MLPYNMSKSRVGTLNRLAEYFLDWNPARRGSSQITLRRRDSDAWRFSLGQQDAAAGTRQWHLRISEPTFTPRHRSMVRRPPTPSATYTTNSLSHSTDSQHPARRDNLFHVRSVAMSGDRRHLEADIYHQHRSFERDVIYHRAAVLERQIAIGGRHSAP